MASTGYIQRDSFLHRLDARSKLAALFAILILALVFEHPLYVLTLLLIVLGTWYIAKLPMDFIGGIFKYFTGIALLIFGLQLFFYPGSTNILRLSQPIPMIGFSGFITFEGFMFGLALVLRLIVIMTVAPLLVMTTPLSELMLALVKIKVPYRFAFILTTAMSLLPAIENRASLIQQAQLCRGVADFEGKNLFKKLKAAASLLVPLILGSFRDSQILDVAMSSRAFGAPVKRTFLLVSNFKLPDYFVLAVSSLIFIGGLVIRILNLGVVG